MFNGRPAKPWGSFREGAANLDMVASHGRISKATRVIMLASFSLMAMTRMEVAVADPIVSRCCKSRARHERRCNTKSAIRSTATRMTRHRYRRCSMRRYGSYYTRTQREARSLNMTSPPHFSWTRNWRGPDQW